MTNHKPKLMKNPEKNTESFIQTIKRTIITTTIIAIILYFVDVFPHSGESRSVVFGITWAALFCIVFGGHWLELLFINYIKFELPQNIFVLYVSRVIYWFLSSIPLFIIANFIIGIFLHKNRNPNSWWAFGLLYIGIELFMQLITHLRFKKSFYNGVY